MQIDLSRRNFLKIGSLASIYSIAGVPLIADEIGADKKSIVWIWLNGGISHMDWIDPKMGLGSEYVWNRLFHQYTDSPVKFAGGWRKLSEQRKRLVVVNSLKVIHPNHNHAAHELMTGFYNSLPDVEPAQVEPSHGSVVSAIYGTNNSRGLPTYVKTGNQVMSDGGWMSRDNNPYEPSKEAIATLKPSVESERFRVRYNNLLKQIREKENNPLANLQDQAYNMVESDLASVFQTKDESDDIKRIFNFDKSPFGRSLVLARRLVENGCRFITVNSGQGWDHHVGIEAAHNKMVPPTDALIAAFIEDIYQRGLDKNTLIVVATEFGRTPKINKDAGRDHWPGSTSLMFAGGGYETNRVIGATDKTGSEIVEGLVTPADIRATILTHFGIDLHHQIVDPAGRPRYLVENGKAIL